MTQRHDNQKQYMRNHRPKYDLALTILLWFPVILTLFMMLWLGLLLMGVL